MRSALDTNILSAIWGQEPNGESLSTLLAEASQTGSLVICGVVYAESLANPKATESFIDGFLLETGTDLDSWMDREVWLEAGRAHRRYVERRRRSGAAEPKRLLADFIVGAHALLRADRLITLDRGRYEKDFPGLVLM